MYKRQSQHCAFVVNEDGSLSELPQRQQLRNFDPVRDCLLYTSDAIGTVAGACMGTSTVTSYVESSAGVAEGGRTGLTALTTAVLFILSIFLAPIFLAIPGFATAPALVIVGMLMMSSVSKVKFEGDMADVLGAFVAIIMMPFTYSIANGIMFGVLVWLVLKRCV